MLDVKIALLILATSKKRDMWKSIKDSYLFNYTLKSFLLTKSNNYKYIIYIGIDKDDRIFSKESEQNEVIKFSKVFDNIEFKFITMDNIQKGYVTLMWNKLFKEAYNYGCEYFYQCGDDIEFKTKNWIDDCVKKLESNNYIGLTGPINNNNRILTQAFVSRKHMEIFGWFFPKEIKNWFCDDWITKIYYPEHFYLINHQLRNIGGVPRYNIVSQSNWKDLVKRDREILTKYIQKSS